jgi:DNA-binding response OmpR family regulator
MAALKKGLRILIVDDDRGIRDFMRRFCEVNGYDADFAGNGSDALALLREEGPFGLVIVDFLMPGMHGVEFVRQLREQWKSLPVIALSAWFNAEASFLDAGATRFFAKPFDPNTLKRAIEEVAPRAQ